ncbi:acetylornithine deacetylase [Natronospira proteinivora]|uniref:Acetylornithine deacetylase n=1 Tax=Natronospira proteinivora TaxID=1807133 RepID=A0ABT1GAS0_9GAMM|nr:acetylornithine deacetylase [Natronospira proteinivora]MCP1728415.1 acetylornithine deacetylase [Natronospira proteinivora]
MRPSLDQMLSELISAPSMSSVSPAFDTGNRLVSERLAGWLEDLGFEVKLQAVEGKDKFNVIATLGRGNGGLVLSGHTDTVPYDEDRWNTDPFQLTEKDGRLYGLGTCDMKAFLGIAIEAASRYRSEDLAEPIIILGTADEESSMAGGKALVAEHSLRARCAIIGEPTRLRPVHLHKGIYMEGVRLKGRSGHSSDPSLGNNALDGMHRVLGELLAFRDQMSRDHHNAAFHVPNPTLNLGHIHGGDNPNRICPEAEVHYDLRTLPEQDMDATRQTLQGRVREVLKDSGLEIEFLPLFDGVGGLDTPEEAAIVQAVTELTGREPEAVAFSTEGPFLQELGIDTVIIGPGDIAQAHQPDEFLDTHTIQPTLDLVDGLIQRFCVKKDTPA